ncbi:MAG: hypothetical protein ABI874_00325 [Chloroflexota bacterium]
MDPRFGQAAFRIGMFMALSAGAMLLVLDRNSAEFVVSLLTVVIALAFMGVIALVVRDRGE